MSPRTKRAATKVLAFIRAARRVRTTVRDAIDSGGDALKEVEAALTEITDSADASNEPTTSVNELDRARARRELDSQGFVRSKKP